VLPPQVLKLLPLCVPHRQAMVLQTEEKASVCDPWGVLTAAMTSRTQHCAVSRQWVACTTGSKCKSEDH
jgi:hypothetical protein